MLAYAPFRVLLLLLVFTACTDAGSGADEEWGMDGPLEPLPPPGKEDSQYRKGLSVATDTTRTQVWTAKNKWEDTNTPAARAAGMAWAADSGLTWDQKYVKWIESMRWIAGVDGYSMTVELTTPWGKTLPSPILECAEVAIFLRITFAAWYELPLQLEAQDSRGQRIYFGHYGVRTASGRYAESPEFALVYKDHTNTDWRTRWPTDATLRKRKLWGGTDEQTELGAGEVFGAYVDEIHLNKRAAYFTVLSLNYLYSGNLADAANMYNVVPDAVAAGDVLIGSSTRSDRGPWESGLRLHRPLEGALASLRRVLAPGGVLVAPTYLHAETTRAGVLSRLFALTGFPGRRRFTARSLREAITCGFQVEREEVIAGPFPIGFVVAAPR